MNDCRDQALAFFEKAAAATRDAGGPPALGLHTLIGETTSIKFKNMITNIGAGHIAPVELVARKPVSA